MTGQNTSTAVMNRRHEAPDSLDFYPTPPWATRALCERLRLAPGMSAWDPACGEGDMVRPLEEYFETVHASDIHDYGPRMPAGRFIADFLGADGLFPAPRPDVDWIVTNPPFVKAAEFILHGLAIARRGVAVLVRTSFTEGVERYGTLFHPRPPSMELQFSERVVMARGRLRDPDRPYRDPADGTVRRPSTATAYCWLVWERGRNAAWIKDVTGPVRHRLTRRGDYPPLPEAERVGAGDGVLV